MRSAVTHAGSISPMKKIMDFAVQYRIKSGIDVERDVDEAGKFPQQTA
ncbi:MAG: hypothetical protein IT521_13520 [Burkholderiales bacterium]|nr:hypothetical protein [Burkholderiales bacterium]